MLQKLILYNVSKNPSISILKYLKLCFAVDFCLVPFKIMIDEIHTVVRTSSLKSLGQPIKISPPCLSIFSVFKT